MREPEDQVCGVSFTRVDPRAERPDFDSLDLSNATDRQNRHAS